MKVVKKGAVPLYKAKCSCCGAELEAGRDELQERIALGIFAGIQYFDAKCPVCNSDVFAWKRKEDKI